MPTTSGDHFVRKDALPDATMARIRAILEPLGFRQRDERWFPFQAWDACHSCQLRYDSYPLLFANGKGVTEALARASAMGEFMERLQCRLDWLFTQAGHIHRYPSCFDRRRLPFAALVETAPELAAGELAGAGRRPAPAELSCGPFIDVLAGRIVDLPYDVLSHASGTNGMCAGNSPEEAIVHGLCEVFERHAIRQVASREVGGLPTVPLDRLPPAGPVVERLLQSIRRAGIEVTVKDATLGGTFPVLAVVLVDRAGDTCQVSFGSDPVFGLALERCLTEAFQGVTALQQSRSNPHNLPRTNDIANTLELLTDQLLSDAGTSRVDGAFIPPTPDNRIALGAALGVVRRLARPLYVGDFSVLGFPSYYVYLQGLSPMRDTNALDRSALPGHANEMRGVLFGLFQAQPDAVAWCAGFLFDEMTRGDAGLEKTFLRDVLAAPIGRWIGLRPLVATMLLESGDAGRARELLDRPAPTRPDLLGDQTLRPWREALPDWIAGYRRLRGPRLDSARLADGLRALDGTSPEQATNDHGPTLAVPRCLNVYCCPSCPCRTWCHLDEWYRLSAALRGAIRPVDTPALTALAARLRDA